MENLNRFRKAAHSLTRQVPEPTEATIKPSMEKRGTNWSLHTLRMQPNR